MQLGFAKYYNVIVPAGKVLDVNNIMYLAANCNIKMYWLYYGCIIIVGRGLGCLAINGGVAPAVLPITHSLHREAVV